MKEQDIIKIKNAGIWSFNGLYGKIVSIEPHWFVVEPIPWPESQDKRHWKSGPIEGVIGLARHEFEELNGIELAEFKVKQKLDKL